jgi:hypothetical protein
MTANNEIRSYLNPSNGNITFGAFGVGFLFLQLIAISNGRFLKKLPVFLLIYPAIALVWYAQRKSTYIAVDLDKQTLNGSAVFFLPVRKIPIASITHIGTRGMYLGGLTVMAITYISPNGKKKTVGVGAKQTLDEVQFQKILDALVELNPKLHVPSELRS